MTKEEKELLLKDLCARLPYGIKCVNVRWPDDGYVEVYNIWVKAQKVQIFEDWVDIENCKPYLRPMSSITEEELKECRETCKYRQVGQSVLDCATCETFEWLNSHHFDYRGLIEKGIALEAPEGMYK